MEQHSKYSGLLPSAMALKDLQRHKRATSSEPMLFTPSQLALLRQSEAVIDAYSACATFFFVERSESVLKARQD